jgi:outer membrane protein assembly factor BamB
MNDLMFRGLAIGALLLGLTACGSKSEIGTKLKGERLPVLSFEQAIEADPALADVPIMLPPPFANEDWSQPGGSPGKAMGHVMVGSSLRKVWSRSIGDGETGQRKLLAAPVVAGGRLFAMDTSAQVTALDAASGRPLWQTRLRFEKRSKNLGFGGGVSVCDGRVYAATGYGFVAALNPASGAEQWRKDFAIPLRGAPGCADGKVYVQTQDNQLTALSADKGEELWSASAIVENAGLLGAGAPAIAGDTLVIGYSSGELNAIKTDNGQVTWQDNLARSSRLTALASLTDIDASPVIDRNRVFAVGHGGRMVALDLATGERVWERSIGGTSTPWAALDFLFVVTVDSQVVALTRKDGKVRWVTQLQRYEDVDGRKGLVRWQGPVLASDRLLLTSSNGFVASLSPYTGALLSSERLGNGSWLPPVVAGGMLFMLAKDGDLIAYK